MLLNKRKGILISLLIVLAILAIVYGIGVKAAPAKMEYGNDTWTAVCAPGSMFVSAAETASVDNLEYYNRTVEYGQPVLETVFGKQSAVVMKGKFRSDELPVMIGSTDRQLGVRIEPIMVDDNQSERMNVMVHGTMVMDDGARNLSCRFALIDQNGNIMSKWSETPTLDKGASGFTIIYPIEDTGNISGIQVDADYRLADES